MSIDPSTQAISSSPSALAAAAVAPWLKKPTGLMPAKSVQAGPGSAAAGTAAARHAQAAASATRTEILPLRCDLSASMQITHSYDGTDLVSRELNHLGEAPRASSSGG